MKEFISSFKPGLEAPQSKEDIIRNIREACAASKKMSTRDFVYKYSPAAGSPMLYGIQSAETIWGNVDMDWALTLAYYNLRFHRIIHNTALYIGGKPLWNLLRGYNISNNYFCEDEARAIAMAGAMTYWGMKFHEFFPWR